MASRLSFCLHVCLTIRLAAQDQAGAAAQVRRLEEKWTEAYKERDIDILSTLLTEDFVITVEDGNTYSKAGYITHSADPTVHVESCGIVGPAGASARRQHRRGDRGVSREGTVQGQALRVSRPADRCLGKGWEQLACACFALQRTAEIVSPSFAPVPTPSRTGSPETGFAG